MLQNPVNNTFIHIFHLFVLISVEKIFLLKYLMLLEIKHYSLYNIQQNILLIIVDKWIIKKFDNISIF